MHYCVENYHYGYLENNFGSPNLVVDALSFEDDTDDDLKRWEIVDELEEDINSGKFRLPAFAKLVFKWEEENLERVISLAIDRPVPSGIAEEPK